MTIPAHEALLPVDGGTFRRAMSRLAAPLTVVTTRDATGAPRGFTASSTTAASLEPPLLVVGISHTSSCHGALSQAPEFVVNVLGRQHRAVAELFARSGVDRFAGQDFTSWPGSGLPCLPGAHATLRCVARERIPVGDHDLLIGELVGVLTSESTEPLLWYDRAFRTLTAAL
ncbi:flavin reductase family protein [Streptomyces rimosus]|uniref:flavin reductase family protein n=1 Tax=Streptomyces rimosus TaxID=1927 RepID=UPI00067C0654|nr:flavin reductase family protein [Streptomyces rimosus]